MVYWGPPGLVHCILKPSLPVTGLWESLSTDNMFIHLDSEPHHSRVGPLGVSLDIDRPALMETDQEDYGAGSQSEELTKGGLREAIFFKARIRADAPSGDETLCLFRVIFGSARLLDFHIIA